MMPPEPSAATKGTCPSSECRRTGRVVLQARVGSSRLPGKILAPVAGVPLVVRAASRLLAAAPDGLIWQLVVATTTLPEDDATEQLCRAHGLPCFRGSPEDVLARFAAATADLAEDDLVIRATADNPAYCPRRTEQLVAEHLRSGAHYTCIEGLSYVVPEVVHVAALRDMAMRADTPYQREHVTPWLRERQTPWSVVQLPRDWRGLRPDLRLTVDTPVELDRLDRTLRLAEGDRCTTGRLAALEEIYAAYEAVGAARQE
jgi:spore coat polysaccharide biosynthesis protein SpsF